MALVTERSKDLVIYDDTAEADGDLSDYINCVVMHSAQSSGNYQVKAPTGQGVLPAGVVVATSDDTLTDTNFVPIRTQGVVKIKANAAFNAGIQLAIADAAGTVAAASSGDFIVGISREAATAANHLVSVELHLGGGQLN